MLLAWIRAAALAGAVTPPSATVSGAGEQEAVFTIDTFGRYAVTARSPHGAAVRVVDAMTGPGRPAGTAGERDGRLDLFLDRGRIKVQAISPAAATDEVVLQVTPFAAPPTPPRLVERRAVKDTLRDLETRGYWVEVDEARSVAFEASGRHLADLRLWRDGSWLVDAVPRCAVAEPVPGQPWRRCHLVTPVEPGLYLLAAYGGPGEPWAEQSDDAELRLRWGVPQLGSAGRRTETVGPDGILRWQVPRGPDTFVLALPEVDHAELRVGAGPSDPFAGGGSSGRITPESRRPVVRVGNGADTDRIVTVTAAPGTAVTLVWFDAGTARTLRDPGHYWIATVTAADPADVLEPTAVVYRRTAGGPAVRGAAQGLPLDGTHPIERRFDLKSTTRVLLDVASGGPYVARIDGTEARLRIEPFLTERPAGYRPPKATRGAFSADLEPGLYVLEIAPEEPGIATLTVAHDSWASRAKRGLGAGADPVALRPAVQLPDVEVERGGALEVSVLAGADVGIVARSLPIDPVDPLPLALMPGETVTVPVRVDAPGKLTAALPTGETLPLSVDGGPEVRAVPMPAGLHRVRVRSDRPEPVLAALGLVPDRWAPDRPLPPLDPARLAALPDFPALGVGEPRFTDLDAGRSATWSVVLPEPGLFVVESTGLLATAGAVRTRTLTALASAEANGVGRNFAVARYYGAGDYQLTVSAVAPSAGRVGLRVRRTTVHDGGVLELGTDGRATVPAGDAVRYRFTLAEPATVRITHRGRAGPFRCRIEDGDGWPVTTPDQPCDVSLDLRAGDHVVIGLPELVETRRVTTVALVEAPAPREGHGPFALAPGADAAHVWTEPAADAAERPPDVWEVALQAPVTATVQLSPEMAGTLSAGGEVLARLVPGEPWRGEVPAGTARIEVRGARRGTGVPYRIRFDTDELVAGGRRRVRVPAEVPVAVGAPGVYTLGSDGDRDVRATLVDAGGRVVAANDDRPDDWNFQLTARLAPGKYTLRIEDVEGTSGPVEVHLRAPRDVPGPAVPRGRPVTVRPGLDAAVLPVAANRGDVLCAEATSDENVGVAIETDDAAGGGWRALTHGTGRRAEACARPASAGWRLRVWSEDGRGGEVRVRAIPLQAGGVDDDGTRRLKDLDAVRLRGGPGAFQVTVGGSGRVWACPAPGAGCAAIGPRPVAAGEGGLVLVGRDAEVRTRRIRLGPVPEVVSVGAERRTVDLADPGPVVVVARGPAGRPGVAVDGAKGIGAGDGASVAISAERAARIEVWSGTGDPMDVRVSAHRLSAPDRAPLRDGRNAVEVPPGGALALGVDAGRDVRAALGAGLVLATADGRVGWAAGTGRTVHVPGVRGRVILANPTDREGLAVIDVNEGETAAPIAFQDPYERLHTAPATWLLPVAAGDGALRLAGAEGTYLRADGAILPADGAAVGGGGVLALESADGPAVAWVERVAGQGPVREVRAGRTRKVDRAGPVPLKGAAEALELKLPAGAIARVRLPVAAIAAVTVPGGYDRTEVVPANGRLDVVLPEGRGAVLLRAFAGGELTGAAAVSVLEAPAVGEGLGPRVLLGPDDAAYFRFTLDRDAAVGVGARAEAERVDAVLLDRAGVPLGRGLVLMREIPAGEYLIGLVQGPGTRPVAVQPALVGVEAPPEAPPEEVVRRYVQLDEGGAR